MKVLKTSEESIEDILYRLGWIFLLIAALIWLAAEINPILRQIFFTPCYFLMITGMYCPGCGGTRAMHFLIHGQILKSLIYHPFVLYGGGLFLCFMISHSLNHLTRGRIPGMKYRSWYLYISILIVILNWIVKNAAYIVWNLDLLNI